MALSLESIHQPLNDFFLNQFKTDAGSPILFRFDKFGSVVSDQDFIDPNHPELGYLSALATEKFSDLVNHIPVDTDDGTNIFLSADSIDTTYFFRLLTGSLPYTPPGIDDNAKQAIITAFSSIKADSLKVWDSLKAESMTGLMLQYKPSLATPADWYDMSKNEIWTSHSFQITETTSEPATRPSNQLWKLKLSDAAMLRALQLPAAENDAANRPRLNIAARVVELHAASAGRLAEVAQPLAGEARVVQPFAERVAVRPLAEEAKIVQPFAAKIVAQPLVEEARVVQPFAAKIVAQPLVEEAKVAPSMAALSSSFALHNTYLQQSKALSVSQRLLVNQYVVNDVPTQPAKTSSLSISFDYCLVNVRRPWYVDAFINDKSWYVPTVLKGQVTSSGPTGNLSWMPIGFVAIRNLKIESTNWAPEDVTNASVATQFGPFKVTGSIVNNTLSTQGLQIIGWVLQKMPDLPPNDPPK